jgi:flagella basal body P-ring formation protein FlgA
MPASKRAEWPFLGRPSVLHFPAMKKLCMVPLLLLLTSCHSKQQYQNSFNERYNDHILIAVRDIPAGTVLQPSDLTLTHGPTIYSDDVACLSEPVDVIGQKTLRPLAKGETLHASNIERLDPPYLCRDVADGWDGYRQRH